MVDFLNSAIFIQNTSFCRKYVFFWVKQDKKSILMLKKHEIVISY